MSKIDANTQEKEIKEIKKYLKNISDSYKTRSVVGRSLLSGIFTAIGATVGFALFIFLAAQLVSGIRFIPILNDILRATKIDVLIESQLNKIAEEDSQGESTTQQIDNSSYVTYETLDLGLAFFFPSYLSDGLTESAGNAALRFTGNGPLSELEFYQTEEVIINGSSITQYVQNSTMGQVKMQIYESGATINETYISNPIYVSYVSKLGLTVIGTAQDNSPKIAREIFISILESLRSI